MPISPTASKSAEASRNPRIDAIAEFVLDKKAEDVVLIDVRERCPYADYFLLASARSTRQVVAICSHVEKQMKERFAEKTVGTEGYQQGHWVLLDYGDVVVHVFHRPTRELYDLDGLWSDAPRRRIADD